MPGFASAKRRKLYPRKSLHNDGIYSHFDLIEDGNGDFNKYCVVDKAHKYFVVQCKSCATAQMNGINVGINELKRCPIVIA